MATVPWDTLIPLLAPHLQGVPDMTLRTALASAAQDFLAQTHLWREPLDPFDTEAGEAVYPLVGPAGSVVESVLAASLDNTLVLTHTDRRFVDPTWVTRTGRPALFWVHGDQNLVLNPTPDGVYSVAVTVALKPSRAAAGVESWVYESWADTLVDGAVWKLASIPNKHWSDLALAQHRKVLFDRAIANAKARDLRQIKLRMALEAF